MPIALRAAGVTAEAFENRRLAEPPKLSQGWDAFQHATRYLIDRMPLRAQAVRLNTRVWVEAFGADPRYGEQVALAQNRAVPFAGGIDERGRVLSDPARAGQPGSQAKRRARAVGFGVTVRRLRARGEGAALGAPVDGGPPAGRAGAAQRAGATQASCG